MNITSKSKKTNEENDIKDEVNPKAKDYLINEDKYKIRPT